MPLPTNGFRNLVIPCDSDGNQVGIIHDGSTYRLAVDALIAGPIVIGAVEIDDGGSGGTRASVKGDGVAIPSSPNNGGLLISGRDPSDLQRHIRVDSAGKIVTSSTPGTTITTLADTAVAAGATVSLPAVSPNTRRRTVQVTGGDATTRIRVREAGSEAGRGIILLLYGSRKFGETGGAIAELEVENVAGPDATVAVQDERD